MCIDIETVSFIVGALLLIYVLIDIEFIIKDLHISRPTKSQKIKISIIAFLFVIVGVTLHVLDKYPPVDKIVETFYIPMYKGYRLDNCLVQGYGCRWAVANKYCKSEGFDYAIDGEIEWIGKNHIKTRSLGDDSICENDSCAAFTYITCIK